MSRGKHLSLEEARKDKASITRFAKEHPSEGDLEEFETMLAAMAGKPKTKPEDD